MSANTALPIIALSDVTSCVTLRRGVVWRERHTTRLFGRVSVLDAAPRLPCRTELAPGLVQLVSSTLASVKVQLNGTAMRYASTAMIARHARRQLQRRDPQLTSVTAALLSSVVSSVRERLCSEPWCAG